MKAQAWMYKWKCFWISWVLERGDPLTEGRLYYDNDPFLVYYPDRISYFSIHLNKWNALKRLKRFCKKYEE